MKEVEIMNKEIPVFLFNGFLDSGKSTLIKEIIESEENYQNYNTLIISLEEGEVEFDSNWLKKYQVNYVYIEEDEHKEEEFFLNLVKKYNPKQIVIELNAFIDINEVKLPRNFAIYQEVTLFDATKFEVYFNNMKPMINQMVMYSSLVVFNRCSDVSNLSTYRRMIRAFNQQTEIAFEMPDGKMTTILDEDLPYDINSDNITLEDKDYPIWYLDVTECFDKYENKTINFNAFVRDAKSDTLVVGRRIMTCCEDDIQFYGFECLTTPELEDGTYVNITCNVVKSYSSIANGFVIMLKVIEIEVIDNREEEYLEFN